MKSITLKINNTGAWYANQGVIPWSSTNLPADSFSFQEREAIFWEVAMLAYNKTTGVLKIQVIDFEALPSTFRPQRKMKQPVRGLFIVPMDAEAFKSQLVHYKIDQLRAVLSPLPLPPSASTNTPKTPAPDVQLPERTITFSYPIMNLDFHNGKVTGRADLPGLVTPIPFTIPNDHLVAEFEAIKPFFAKALKRKTIRVTAKLDFKADIPFLHEISSPQVAAINTDMLEIFRGRAMKALISPGKTKVVDKSLFTPDDIFDSLDDNELGKATLPQGGQDLLAEILRLQQVRNARQLEFLAGRLHQPGTKLRFAISSKFGFVFLAIGREANHFILELLNTHATYIWSIPKFWETLDDQYKAVEKEIATIGQIGRNQYRRTLHFEHEFWYVVHESAESSVVDGFPRWKNRLLEGMV